MEHIKHLSLGWLVGAAALLFAGCSSEDGVIAEEPKTIEPQATVIHVTVGAGITDGVATTRSTVDVTTDGETGKKTRTLKFTGPVGDPGDEDYSAGDKLYVWRELAGDVTKYLAGELTMKDGSPTADGTQASFEGELTVYDGTGAPASYDFQGGNPMAGATATLLHAGMKETDADGGDYSIDGATKALTFADATGVAASVEALMTKGLVVSGLYDAENDRFPLSATQPILNCTIAGLTAWNTYKVEYIYGATAAMSDHSRKLFSSMEATGGTLSFAFIAETGDMFHGIRLTNTAEPTDTYDATIGQKAFASKVYNAARTAVGKKTPLTMEALEPGSIVVQSPKSGMKYKINNLAPVTLGTNDATFYVAKGDKVQFYGNGTSITKYLYTYITGGTATVKVYGNIMSLVDETGFATATTLDSDYAFTALFATNAKLTDASGLLLPATTLNTACYAQMFAGCTSLTAAPELPAETLASYCYQQMFINCRSLTTAPALDATTLTLQCYEEMFSGCTSLTTAPVLPAETLARRSYWRMFYGCTKLSAVKCLATDKSATGCTDNWLSGVAATGTFTKASTMTTWPSGIDGIPDGWTVENAQ